MAYIATGRLNNFSEVWDALSREQDYYPVPAVRVAIFGTSAILGMPCPDAVWLQFEPDAPAVVNRVKYTGRLDLDLGPVPGTQAATVNNLYLSRPNVYTPSLMGPTDAARRTVKTEVANLVTGYMGTRAGRELVRLAVLRWHMDRRQQVRRQVADLVEDLGAATTTANRHTETIKEILGGLDKPEVLTGGLIDTHDNPAPDKGAKFAKLADKYYGWLEPQLYDPDPDPRLEEGTKATQEEDVKNTLIKLMEEVTT